MGRVLGDRRTNGTLQRLEERRIDWRAKRAVGEVSLTDLMPLETEDERRWAYFLPGQEIPDEAVELAPASVREWKILDPAVGSGHFLVVALGLLLALFQEEARHRGMEDAPEWSERAIVEHLLAYTLHGIDIDPRAVQIAAASLWLKGKSLCPEIEPEQLNLVAPNLRLADLPDDDPALVELRFEIKTETGIDREFTSQILEALRGADHLGSLLKIDQAVDSAIDQQEQQLKAQRPKVQHVQLSLSGEAPPVQAEMDFSPVEARADLQELLEQFLSRHSSANDLGLRLHGEQLAAGVRFVRLLKEGSFHLVIANPPYQGTGKMESTSYVELHYPLGKADLYAAFLLRGLELVKPGGMSAMLTMRNWMFIKQYSGLREQVFGRSDLRTVGDFAVGAFDDVANDVLSVSAALIANMRSHLGQSSSQMPTPVSDTSYDRGRTARKRSATLAQEGLYKFQTVDLKVVPEWPLVYWWDSKALKEYSAARLLGQLHEVASGITTGNNERFVRAIQECPRFGLPSPLCLVDKSKPWQPFVNGAAGVSWIETTREAIKWRHSALELHVFGCYVAASVVRLRDPRHHFIKAVPFAMIGNSFSARAHWHPSLIGKKGASIVASNQAALVCLLNSARTREMMSALNPGVGFEMSDVARVPVFEVRLSDYIFGALESSFQVHESHRELSIEYRLPGPSPWRHAQDWAQQASPLKRPFPMGACALPAEKTEPPEHSPAKQRNHWRQSAFPC